MALRGVLAHGPDLVPAQTPSHVLPSQIPATRSRPSDCQKKTLKKKCILGLAIHVCQKATGPCVAFFLRSSEFNKLGCCLFVLQKRCSHLHAACKARRQWRSQV